MSGKRTIAIACTSLVGSPVAVTACADADGGRGAGPSTGPGGATLPSTGDHDTGGVDTSSPDGSGEGPSASTSVADDAPGDSTGNADASDAGDTTTGEGVPFMLDDPLVDGTMGTAIGGTFGPDGWTTTERADRIIWELPRLVTGSVEFTVSGITLDLLPLADHEIFAMYEGGWGIEHPIGYPSLGTSRPLEVDSAGMPVGATFSDVVIEGITGAEATCG